jgi:hypothetical protein
MPKISPFWLKVACKLAISITKALVFLDEVPFVLKGLPIPCEMVVEVGNTLFAITTFSKMV